jgi:tetratricopeptide (TPR) repeat protein
LILAVALGAVAGPLCAQPSEAVPSLPDALQAAPDEQTGKLGSLRRARDAMMNVGDFSAALTPAQNVVNEQGREPDSRYPEDLAALARIQNELGERDTAEKNFLRAIDLIEMADGEYALRLIEAYRGLGRTYIKSARYPEAIAALEQAQHISQRNLGLFNVEQTPLIDDITTAYLGIGDTVEARRMQLERLDNAVRRYGADDPRVFPFRYQLADYYQKSRLPVSAREQYAAVLEAQESHLGAEHPALLPPLRQLVRIDLLTAQTEETAAHDRLVSILEKNPDMDVVERGLSLATLGDWAIVANDPAKARDYYNQAWTVLSANPKLDVASFFAKPAMIDFVPPLSAVDRGVRSRRPYSWGQIVFKFDVSADGRPLNVAKVAERSQPTSAIESTYNRRLRETHFRPRIVDGQPVATENVELTHFFRFYVGKDDGKDDDASESDEG